MNPRTPARLLLASALALAAASASAADRAWTGNTFTDPNWSNPGNWDSGVPSAGDNLLFNSFNQPANNNDLTGLALGWLQFNGSFYTLTGNGVSLSAGMTNSLGDNFVGLPLTLAAAQTWDAAIGSTLVVSNTLSLGANNLTLTGDGNFTLGSAAVLSGSGNLTKNGSGTFNLQSVGNLLTGTLVINGGTVQVNGGWAASVWGNATPRALTINDGGRLYNPATHSLGGLGATFYQPFITINSNGVWELAAEQYVGWSQFRLTAAQITGRATDAIRCNGGTLTNVANAVSTVISAGISMVSSGTIYVEDGAADEDLVISGVINNSGTLTKAGPGKLVLSGENTYTSPTPVNAGTLALKEGGRLVSTPSITLATNTVFDVSGVTYYSYSLSPNQALTGLGRVRGTVNDENTGATLVPGSLGVPGTLALESLNLNGNLAINFDLGATTTVGGTVNDLLIVTNLTLSFFNTNAVNLTLVGGQPALGVPYTFIQYQTTSVPDGIVHTLAAAPSRYTYTFSNNTAAKVITLTVSGAAANLVWKGDSTTNNWDLITTPNWLKNGVTPDVFYQSDNALFDATGSLNPPVNLVGSLQPGVVTVSGAQNYTFAGSGKLSGGARLVKNGSGTLTVTTENDYTGGTVVNDGTLVIGVGGTTGNLAGGNGTNNSRIVINRTGTMTSSANLAGTGSLELNNTGTVNLQGSNTFTGGTLVRNGSLQIGNNPPVAGASIAGPITNYSAVYFGRSDAFTLQSPITGAGNTFVNGAGVIYLRTTAGMTVDGTAGIDFPGSMNVSQDVFGRLFVAPGGNLNLGGEMLVGNPGSTSGEVVQNGGDVNIGNRIRLGHWATEVSYYAMNAGTLNVANALNVGWDGIGIFTLNGGTVNALSVVVDANGTTAALNTTNETLTVNGGRLNVGSGGLSSVGGVGGYLVNLGGGTVGASAPWSSSLNISLTNGPGVTFDTGPHTVTLSGILTGTNGLTKQGAGFLTLNTVTNTYSGPTVVAQGTLQGSAILSSPVSVQSGAALSAGATAATGTLTVSNNVTVSPGAQLVVDASTTAATSDRVDVRGTLSLDPAGTPVYFNFLGGRPFTGGAYTIVSNLLPRTGTISVVNPSRYVATVDESNPNRIQVSFTGTNATLVWKGNVNNLWDVNQTANWLASGAASTFYPSDAVNFDGTGLGTPNVTLAGSITPASVTVAADGDYTFSGAGITGLGTLTKSGSGKLTLANDNTFSGLTTVGFGTLQIGNGGTAGSLLGNVLNNSSVVFNRSDAALYAGVISGAGTLLQTGAGRVTLTGANTYSGGTAIAPGSTLQIGAGLATGTAGLGPIVVPTGASLVLYRNDGPTVGNLLSGSGTITFRGTGATGAGSSQGSYTLSANNTFSGLVTLDQARLNPSNPNALGNLATYVVPVNSTLWPNVAGAVFTPALSLAGAGWPEAGGYLGALRLGSGSVWAGPITLAGYARISAGTDANDNRITGTISGGSFEADFGSPGGGAGVLTLAPSTPNTFGALRVSPGILIAGNANALPATVPLIMNGGTLRLNGNSLTAPTFASPVNSIIQNGSATTPSTITFNVNDAVTYGGTFADLGAAPLAVVKNGSGLLTLTAINTSLGGVTVNGGVLALNNGGGNGTVKGTLTANPGALILSLNGDSIGYNGGNAQVTNLVLNGGSFIHAPNNNLSIWQNAVVTMTGGYLAATNAGNAARLDFGAGASVATLPSANSSVIFTTGASGTASGVYLRQANTIFNVADGPALNDLLINAPVNQAAAGYGITKSGAGRLYLAGPVTYTGATTVNGGSLVFGPNASLASATGPITLGTGATLDLSASQSPTLNLAANQLLAGSGTVVASVNDSFGSVIRPGNSAGTLTINGNLTLSGYGALEFELANVTTVGGGVNDLIQVNGNLALNDFAPTLVNFSFLNGVPTAGTYTLLKYSGTFSGNPATGLVAGPGYQATFTHVAGSKEIRVTFTSPNQSLVWEGDSGPNTWDLSAYSTAWFNGTVNTNFYQADTVRFDDSRTFVNTYVTVAEAVKPAAVTVDSAYDYSLTGNGRLSGATGITKQNTGKLTLGMANDFTGPVNVNGGVLALADAAAMPAGANITVASGAAFDFAGMGNANVNNLRALTFTIGGSGPDGNGALLNSGIGIFSYANVSNLFLTADAVLGGNNGRWDLGLSPGSKVDGRGFNLTKRGSFQMSFRPQIVTNLASLTVEQGNLYFESYHQTNPWTALSTNYVRPGASLGNYGALAINFPVVLDSATVQNQGGASPSLWTGPFRVDADSLFNNSAAQVFAGSISGPGAIWVNGGTAALTFSNASTYAGGTIISNGPSTLTTSYAQAANATIVVGHPAALGSGPVTINASSVTADTITNTFRPLEFSVTGGGTVPNDLLLPTNPLGITNLSLAGRDNTSVFTLAGKISGGHENLTNWFDFSNSGSSGVLRLSNPANDFTARLLNVNRGVLAITAGGCLGNPANVLRLDQGSTVGALRFDAPGVNVAHTVVFNSTTSLNLFGDNNGDGLPETANDATLSGVAAGGAAVQVRGGTNALGTSTGSLALSGNNTFSGAWTVVSDTKLIAAHANALGTTAGATTVAAGGTLALNLNGAYANEPLTLNGAGVLAGGVGVGALQNLAGANTLGGTIALASPATIAVPTGSLSLGGVISGAQPLIKIGDGPLTLTGANSYSGSTLVNGGTLIVSGSLAAGSAVTVAAGATLAGNGTINGPATVQTAGVLSPGVGGIGRLTLANTLTLGGSVVMEINPAINTNDVITGLTYLRYGGALVVNNLGGTLTAGSTFKLFNAWAYLGSFTSFTLPALANGLSWDTSGLLEDGSIKVVEGAPPTLSGATVLPDGNFQLTLTGSVGQAYKLLATSDVTAPLSTWTVLEAGTLPSATYQYTDLTATNHAYRFYVTATP